MEIIPNVHQIPGITANSFLLVDPDGLTLIDAGLPRSQKKILTYIAGLGFAASDLKRILITHADSDHVGGLAALQTATPARTYAHPVEAQAIVAGQFSRPLKLHGWRKWLFDTTTTFFRARSARVDERLQDGAELPVLGGLRAVESIGHTPGHLSFYAPQFGILFCGDSLRTAEGALKVSRGANTWDQALANQAARRQAELGATIICAGHGQVLRDAPQGFITLLAQLDQSGD